MILKLGIFQRRSIRRDTLGCTATTHEHNLRKSLSTRLAAYGGFDQNQARP